MYMFLNSMKTMKEAYKMKKTLIITSICAAISAALGTIVFVIVKKHKDK